MTAALVVAEAPDWRSAIRRDHRPPPAWVNAFIGIPYADKGRERAGCDCWGLVRLAYAEQLGLELPSFAHCYDGRFDSERIQALIESVVTGWQEVVEPEIGDAVWMWIRRPANPYHVAIYVGSGMALTAFSAAGSALIDLREERWGQRVHGFYRPESTAAPEVRPLPTPAGKVRVIAPTTVLGHERFTEDFAPGLTVEELLNAIAPRISGEGEAIVTVGGIEVPPERWALVRPKAGVDVRVEYVAEPWLIPILVIMAQAAATAGSVAAGAVGLGGVAGAVGSAVAGGLVGLGAGVTAAAIVGNLVIGVVGLGLAAGVVAGVGLGIQALFKTSTPDAPKTGKDASPTLNGVGNALRQFEPIPVVFGRHRIFPSYAAPPYTFVKGGKQWVRALVALQGRYKITYLKIGDVPIESISGTRWQIREGGRVKTYEAEIQTSRANGSAVHRFYRMVHSGGVITDTLDPAVTATVQGGGYSTVPGLVYGDSNQAVSLTSANAVIPTAGFALPSGSWTATFLVQLATLPSSGTMLMIGDRHNGNGVELEVKSNGDMHLLAGGAGTNTRIRMMAGKPYHLAVSYDGIDSLGLHVNGQQANVEKINSQFENFFSIGGSWRRSNSTNVDPTPGVYDDFQIWTPGLSPNEITALHDFAVAGAATRGGFLGIFTDTWSEASVNHSFPTAEFDEADVSEWHVVDVPGTPSRVSFTINHFGCERKSEVGKRREFSYKLEAEVRDLALGDSAPWQDLTAYASLAGVEPPVTIADDGSLVVRDKRGEPFLRQYDADLPHASAQWQVRFRRTELEAPNNRPGGDDASIVLADALLVSVRGGIASAPIKLEGLCTVAIEAPVDELGGNLGQINMIAESLVPIYDASGAVVSESVTRNAADHVLWAVLQHPAEYETLNPWPENPANWNFSEFSALRTFIDTEGFHHDEVADTFENVFLLANRILRGSRANLDYHQGQWRPVIDQRQATRVGSITTRNSSGFTLSRTFPPRVHAWRSRFIDETAGWRENQRIDYEDGYDVTTANRFRELDLTKEGITDPDHIRKHVRVEMAKSRLHREAISVQMGPEYLNYKRGQRLGYAHPVAVVGRTAGRVTELFVDGSGWVTGVLLDAEMVYEAEVEFGANVILMGGSRIHVDLANRATVPEEPVRSNRYDFTAPVNPAVSLIEDGCLTIAGVRMLEEGDALLAAIVPNADLSAALHLIPYQPGVYDAADEPIPPFDTQVTLPAPITIAGPPRPTITSIISDELAMVPNDAGTLIPRILVDYTTDLARARIAVVRVEAQYRVTPGGIDRDGEVVGGSEWKDLPAGAALSGRFVVSPAEEGVPYDFRLKAIGENGNHSTWAQSLAHLVAGQSSLPPPPTNLRIERRNELAWSLANRPIDFAGFRVRVHPGTRNDWDTAAPLHEGIVAAQTFPLPSFGGGERTFLVKTVDRAGNESETAALVTTTMLDPDAENAVIAIDHRALGFTGTKAGCSVSSGDLVADAIATDFWAGPDSDPFWTDDAALYWVGSYTAMTYTFPVSHSAADPAGDLYLNLTIVGPYTIEYDRGATGTYVTFPGRAVISPGETISLRISVAAGAVQGKITRLITVVDVPDVVEEILAYVVAVSGTIRLPLAKSYRAITNVLWTAHQAGDGLPRVLELLDKGTGGPPLTGGPSVQSRQANAAGARIAGTFDFRVIGY